MFRETNPSVFHVVIEFYIKGDFIMNTQEYLEELIGKARTAQKEFETYTAFLSNGSPGPSGTDRPYCTRPE